MTSAIDFRRSSSPPRAGWALLATGVLALVIAVGFDRDVVVRQAEADRIAQARMDIEREQHRPARVVPPTASEMRARQAAVDVRQPWLQTLRIVEATTQPPLYLRSLSVEPAAGLVKFEAEAPNFEEALAYAQSLDEELSLRPVLLTSHEQVVDPITHTDVVRFNLIARWNSR